MKGKKQYSGANSPSPNNKGRISYQTATFLCRNRYRYMAPIFRENCKGPSHVMTKCATLVRGVARIFQGVLTSCEFRFCHDGKSLGQGSGGRPGPQWGPGVKPLVVAQGAKPLEAQRFSIIFKWKCQPFDNIKWHKWIWNIGIYIQFVVYRGDVICNVFSLFWTSLVENRNYLRNVTIFLA